MKSSKISKLRASQLHAVLCAGGRSIVAIVGVERGKCSRASPTICSSSPEIVVGEATAQKLGATPTTAGHPVVGEATSHTLRATPTTASFRAQPGMFNPVVGESHRTYPSLNTNNGEP